MFLGNVFPEFSATPFKKFYDLATSAVENDKTNHLDSVTDDGFREKKSLNEFFLLDQIIVLGKS